MSRQLHSPACFHQTAHCESLPVFDRPLAIVDLETTGGHITRDRITEIGILLVDGEQVRPWRALVNPGQPIPPFIEQMTGISNAMVADAPPFEALARYGARTGCRAGCLWRITPVLTTAC